METYVTIPISTIIANQLPPNVADLTEIVALGLKSWRVERALTEYGQGRSSLAYAAQRAGVSLREMIAVAYAHGFEPSESVLLPTSLDEAAVL